MTLIPVSWPLWPLTIKKNTFSSSIYDDVYDAMEKETVLPTHIVIRLLHIFKSPQGFKTYSYFMYVVFDVVSHHCRFQSNQDSCNQDHYDEIAHLIRCSSNNNKKMQSESKRWNIPIFLELLIMSAYIHCIFANSMDFFISLLSNRGP